MSCVEWKLYFVRGGCELYFVSFVREGIILCEWGWLGRYTV